MEDTWYLFPGQTLETTKIEDRGKALIATQEAWDSIGSHLTRKKKEEEILEEEEARKKYMKEGSHNMTKHWTNSFEKIQERRMHNLTMKAKLKEETLVHRFLELRAEQQAERDAILSQLSKKIYMTTEKPRHLNSALLESEILFERNLQIEFNKTKRECERNAILEEAKEIKRNAELELIENAAKAKCQKDTDIRYGQVLMSQINEIQEHNRKAKEEKIKNELLDIERSREEFEKIKKFEADEIINKKADVKRQFKEFALLQKEIKEEKEKQERIKDKIVHIFQRSKCRIDNKKKETVKKAFEEQLQIRSRIADKVMSAKMNNEAEEDERIQNQIKEQMDRESKMNAKRDKYYARLKKENEDYRKFTIEYNAKLADEKAEIKKWELMNRLKTKEVIEKYNLDKLQKLCDKKMKYRRVLAKQIKDINKDDYNKKCHEAEIKAVQEKIDYEDKQFFEYAKEVYDLVKSKGRNTYPVQKVIDKYNKDYNQRMPVKDTRNLKTSISIAAVDKGKPEAK